MPIPGSGLKRELIIPSEVTAQGAPEHHAQNGGAYRHVQPVKTGEKEERGAVGSARQGEAELRVGAVVLVELKAEKKEPQYDRQGKAELELATRSLHEPVMRPGENRRRGEQ